MQASCQLHALAALLPGKELPGTHWIGGWVGSRAGLDAVARENPSPYLEPNLGRPNRSLVTLVIERIFFVKYLVSPRYNNGMLTRQGPHQNIIQFLGAGSFLRN